MKQTTRILLNEATICGIKSIDRPIVLSFTNKNVTPADFDKSFVKGIYGSNGAGKSGIVHAFDIYAFIVSSQYPFMDRLFAPALVQLIHKKNRKCSISMAFSVLFAEGDIVRLRHEIQVGINESKLPFILSETLDELNTRGDFKQNIFSVSNGVYQSSVIPDSLTFERGAPFLRQNSVISSDYATESNKHERGFGYLLASRLFGLSLQTSFGSVEDSHTSFDLSMLQNDTAKVGEPSTGSIKLMGEKAPRLFSRVDGVRDYLWVFPTQEERHYKAIESKLDRFLKLLKPSLKGVTLSMKHDGTYSYCNPVFHYDGYDIDYEFESTGVKKLCQLFTALYSASNHFIVVIDEIDAGIHDVFFEKLVEYFIALKGCQIIFTTHNIDAMESLKTLRRSIDVLTDECETVSWTSKGKSSPSLFYSRGALGGTPLNLQSFDFAPIFEIEEESE